MKKNIVPLKNNIALPAIVGFNTLIGLAVAEEWSAYDGYSQTDISLRMLRLHDISLLKKVEILPTAESPQPAYFQVSLFAESHYIEEHSQ